MGPAITPGLVDIIDVFSAQRQHASGVRVPLDECHIEHWGLSLRCTIPDDPMHDEEVTWLLPEYGLRMTRYRARRRHARQSPTLMTAVTIDHDTRTWATTDLILGLEIPDQGAARVIRSEEFAAAISGGALRLSEADYALRVVHRTLDELVTHREIRKWLAYRGIFDRW